jgi:hypothetical protein
MSGKQKKRIVHQGATGEYFIARWNECMAECPAGIEIPGFFQSKGTPPVVCNPAKNHIRLSGWPKYIAGMPKLSGAPVKNNPFAYEVLNRVRTGAGLNPENKTCRLKWRRAFSEKKKQNSRMFNGAMR